MKHRTGITRLLAVIALVLAGLAGAGGAVAAPGELDPSFGSGGTVLIQPEADCHDTTAAMRQQPDGNLLVAGVACATSEGSGDVLVARLRPDGSLDPTFGDGGRATTDIGPSETLDAAADVVAGADGKIVAGGWTGSDRDRDFALVRYHPDGRVDTSFGDGGRVVQSFNLDADYVHNVHLTADGRIVAVGRTGLLDEPADDLLIARFRADGTPDMSFGNGGSIVNRRLVPAGSTLDDAGNIVVVGLPTFESPWDFVIARYRPNGAPDISFGVHGGMVTTDLGSDFEYAQAVAVQPDGKIVVAGSDDQGIVLVRYRHDGSLDPTFGTNGSVTYPGYPHRSVSLAVQADGRIVVGTNTRVVTDGGVTTRMTLVRFRADGRIDPAFGQSGVATGPTGQLLVAVLRQADGRIVAAGNSQPGMVVSRYLSAKDSTPPPPPTPDPTSPTSPTSPGATTPTTPATIPDPPPAPPVTTASGPSARFGYWMVGADGKVYPFGDARSFGDARVGAAGAVDLEPTSSGNGYWIVDDQGVVYAFGDAVHHGSMNRSRLAPGEKAASLSATPTGGGYWIFTSRGRALTFGDAGFFGDVSEVPLSGPVLDSIPTPTGRGYYMVGSDGGIFALGDARFYGSMGAAKLNAPVQSLVPDADGAGYWLVASDGGIFAFSADFKGSMGATQLNRQITGMVQAGSGYLMVGEDGGIFDFSGMAGAFKGSLGSTPPARPVTSVAVLERR